MRAPSIGRKQVKNIHDSVSVIREDFSRFLSQVAPAGIFVANLFHFVVLRSVGVEYVREVEELVVQFSVVVFRVYVSLVTTLTHASVLHVLHRDLKFTKVAVRFLKKIFFLK